VWNAEKDDEALLTLGGHTGLVYSVVLIADGKRIVSGSYDKTIKIWDSENPGERASSEPPHEADRPRAR